MFGLTLTAIVLPARSAGLVIPDPGSARTACVSVPHWELAASTLMFMAPRAWAAKKLT